MIVSQFLLPLQYFSPLGKTPLIYASTKNYGLAQKWKTDLNENAKIHAFYNVIPEFNHNEICGFESSQIDPYVIILSEDKGVNIRKRVEVFKKLMKKLDVSVTEIGITGRNFTKIFSSIWISYYLSYYLALELGVEPESVKIIEDFKRMIK